ncbi:hypothetical protein O9G_003606 [Rozella allomycis CSF55]|uniref:Uncharacterized protein n=1 Tax=Rozella allomycis (strain CSF55) TaxID=988480 RepID=A0A075AZI7_ROZAC|nr:hypothetical protein O9G_003606 [Rozella allomycis CSF55]|eukprot:EPZ35662.1 hypothetical protein O9G_003606 [Rozella allomycis CSF55]
MFVKLLLLAILSFAYGREYDNRDTLLALLRYSRLSTGTSQRPGRAMVDLVDAVQKCKDTSQDKRYTPEKAIREVFKVPDNSTIASFLSKENLLNVSECVDAYQNIDKDKFYSIPCQKQLYPEQKITECLPMTFDCIPIWTHKLADTFPVCFKIIDEEKCKYQEVGNAQKLELTDCDFIKDLKSKQT